MPALDYEKAADILAELFVKAEDAFQGNTIPTVEAAIQDAADRLFASSIIPPFTKGGSGGIIKCAQPGRVSQINRWYGDVWSHGACGEMKRRS